MVSEEGTELASPCDEPPRRMIKKRGPGLRQKAKDWENSDEYRSTAKLKKRATIEETADFFAAPLLQLVAGRTACLNIEFRS